jgi:hypothetical protein
VVVGTDFNAATLPSGTPPPPPPEPLPVPAAHPVAAPAGEPSPSEFQGATESPIECGHA